jgi:hypothetical protein
MKSNLSHPRRRQLHLSFTLAAITNGLLELGKQNSIKKEIIKVSKSYVLFQVTLWRLIYQQMLQA